MERKKDFWESLFGENNRDNESRSSKAESFNSHAKDEGDYKTKVLKPEAESKRTGTSKPESLSKGKQREKDSHESHDCKVCSHEDND